MSEITKLTELELLKLTLAEEKLRRIDEQMLRLQNELEAVKAEGQAALEARTKITAQLTETYKLNGQERIDLKTGVIIKPQPAVGSTKDTTLPE